jgi:hypothetical protein
MDELERDLAARLHRRSEQVIPGDDLPGRIRTRVEHRQRHRRRLQGAVPTALLLIGALTFGAVEAAGGGGPSSQFAARAPRATSPSNSPATVRPNGPASGASSPFRAATSQGAAVGPDLVAGGWVPIDFGNGRVLVPPGSVTSSAVGRRCADPNAPVTIFPGTPAPSVSLGAAPLAVGGCPIGPIDVTTVVLESVPHGVSTSGLQPTTVNGIKVFKTVGREVAPSLGVQVLANGPLSGKILGTLSRLPHAIALAGGRTPQVPSTWRRVAFGGLSVAVPGDWPETRVAAWGTGCGPTFVLPQPPLGVVTRPQITLDSGTSRAVVECPLLVGLYMPVQSPTDGVVVDPGPIGPLSSVTSYGRCGSIAGLQVCPGHAAQDDQAVLILRVRTKEGATVAVEIGLGGDGQTARTILYSLRPA